MASGARLAWPLKASAPTAPAPTTSAAAPAPAAAAPTPAAVAASAAVVPASAPMAAAVPSVMPGASAVRAAAPAAVCAAGVPVPGPPGARAGPPDDHPAEQCPQHQSADDDRNNDRQDHHAPLITGSWLSACPASSATLGAEPVAAAWTRSHSAWNRAGGG